MRTAALLLALTALCVIPAPALTWAAGAQRVLPCGLAVSRDEVSSFHGLKCMAGTALGVSAHALRVRTSRGPAYHFRLTDETQFETNSGEGALNGLVVHDRVCVAYTSAARVQTARIVAFNPRSNPCGSARRQTSGPGDSGHD